MPVTIVRTFNTFGPRQSARAIIPTIIIQLLSGVSEIKLGSLMPTRDFNYVKDTANGFVEILMSEATIGEEINIATQSEISMEDVAKKIINIIIPNAKIVCDNKRIRADQSEVNRLLGSNEKIKKLTNWKQSYSFDDGINETIERFKINLKLYKSNIYNV